MPDDALGDFERATFSALGKTRTIYRKGTGPAVIVMAEMPGITPDVAGFARKVAGIGCTAVMPHLFGVPGKDIDPTGGGSGGGSNRAMVTYALSSMVPACISREFTVLALGKTSPVVNWLRALAASEHERCGGPGVGAVGMCFTGGFALAMATDPRLLAPVLSQPSLPFGVSAKHRANIDISRDDLEVVKQRCAAEGLQVLGLRFKGDRFVKAERFEFLRKELGDAFVAVELEDDSAKPGIATGPHSVLTACLIDEPGEPTRAAVDQVLDLFRTRLLVDAPSD